MHRRGKDIPMMPVEYCNGRMRISRVFEQGEVGEGLLEKEIEPSANNVVWQLWFERKITENIFVMPEFMCWRVVSR